MMRFIFFGSSKTSTSLMTFGCEILPMISTSRSMSPMSSTFALSMIFTAYVTPVSLCLASFTCAKLPEPRTFLSTSYFFDRAVLLEKMPIANLECGRGA